MLLVPPPADARTIVYCDGAVYCGGAAMVGTRAAEDGATAGAHAGLAYAEGSLSPRSPLMGAQNARRLARVEARQHAQAVRCALLIRELSATCRAAVCRAYSGSAVQPLRRGGRRPGRR